MAILASVLSEYMLTFIVFTWITTVWTQQSHIWVLTEDGLTAVQQLFLPPSLFKGGESVGYESFLVTPSLLCLHTFCVVMSEYLTISS